ncbi:MAG: LacI family DNA-binding transcriptional regulator [Wujia sp.]
MSIKKIAEMTGVSPATVSRVLNKPGYKCSTSGLREKIWKAAMEINYVPNEAARNLKKGGNINKNYYIAVLVTRTDSLHADPFFAELLRIIEIEIHNHMCILSSVQYKSIFSDDRACKTAKLDVALDELDEAFETKPDGIIIIGKCNKEAVKRLKKKYKNVVSVNRNSTNYEVDEVLCDGKKVAMSAVEYLVSLGHVNIGYAGGCRNEARFVGFQDALKKNDIDLVPEYVYDIKQTEAAGYELMQRLLKSDDCPTGIYCSNDIIAIGMLKCLAGFKKKYYQPSIISSDDIEEAQYSNPMLTTVALPKNEMGKFAVYLLVDRIQGGHSGIVRTELDSKLVIRSSCSSAEESGWYDYCI